MKIVGFGHIYNILLECAHGGYRPRKKGFRAEIFFFGHLVVRNRVFKTLILSTNFRLAYKTPFVYLPEPGLSEKNL
jgi:hypothetical protein